MLMFYLYNLKNECDYFKYRLVFLRPYFLNVILGVGGLK